MTRLHPFRLDDDDDLFPPPADKPKGPATGACGHPQHASRTCAQFEADKLGIVEAPDDLRRAVLCQLDYDANAEAGAQALNDQLFTATSALSSFHGYDSRTGEKIFDCFPAFRNSVRTMLSATMAAYRSMSSTVTETGAEEESRIIYSPPGYLPDNPGDQWSVALGLVAGDPVHVQVLRDGPEKWLESVAGQRMACAWPDLLYGRFGSRCLEYTRDYISWSRWQFLVVVPTCAACRQALFSPSPT